jgi:hypothetical protein
LTADGLALSTWVEDGDLEGWLGDDAMAPLEFEDDWQACDEESDSDPCETTVEDTEGGDQLQSHGAAVSADHGALLVALSGEGDQRCSWQAIECEEDACGCQQVASRYWLSGRLRVRAADQQDVLNDVELGTFSRRNMYLSVADDGDGGVAVTAVWNTGGPYEQPLTHIHYFLF